MATSSLFSVELGVFEAHRAEWSHSHRGEYVVIQGDVIAEGFFDSYAEAFRAGLRKFGVRHEFLVKQVWPSERVYLVSQMAKVEIPWNPFDRDDPGPCIDVVVTNSRDVIEAGEAIGLEFPPPLKMRALLDTGASVTVISKQFANYCKLRQTSEGSEISAIGTPHRCGEHAGSISFPGTGLRSFDLVPIVSAIFVKERYYAILIGRDILRNWHIAFDGRRKLVTITE